MTRPITFLAGAALIAATLSTPAFSQGVLQTLSLSKVSPTSQATGYRVSKVVGSAVVNGAKEKVGTIDDLIITQDASVPFAVLSVGGFLGVGTKSVIVPYSSLVVHDTEILFRDATKETVASLPDVSVAKNGKRTSELVGASVINGANETVGTIDDLIVTPNEKVPFAVLSVGGFLGLGTKYVVVSYDALKLNGKDVVYRDATKESLKTLPEFTYSK
jgi:sporulation protein YlmC with PRC-barrel domain